MTCINKLAVVVSSSSLALSACSGEAETPSALGDETSFVFVLHDGLTERDVRHLDIALNENHQRILDIFELDAMHPVTVQIWREEEAYQTVMEETFGSRAPGSRGYVYGDSEIRLLYHTMLSAQEEAVHEFVHNVTLTVNPSMGNNPRWLWEAVAIYYAGQFVDPTTSRAFADGQCPTMEDLESPFNRGGDIYDAGYLLMAFVAERWGEEHILELVRTNADTDAVLGVTLDEFGTQWCAHVEQTYLSQVAQ